MAPRSHRPGSGAAGAAVALVLAALALPGCDLDTAPHEAILGKWRSNAQLTLESVVETRGMTSQSRAFLKGDFFGHQEVEIREFDSRTTNPRDNYDSGYEPYEVLEVADGYVRIRAWSNFFQDYAVRTLYLEGDCFYEIFAGFEFRTYFCPTG